MPAPALDRPAVLKMGVAIVAVALVPSVLTVTVGVPDATEKVKPFDDVHVRRAISYALDRQSIIDSVLFGNAKTANSFSMPNIATTPNALSVDHLRHLNFQGRSGSTNHQTQTKKLTKYSKAMSQTR